LRRPTLAILALMVGSFVACSSNETAKVTGPAAPQNATKATNAIPLIEHLRAMPEFAPHLGTSVKLALSEDGSRFEVAQAPQRSGWTRAGERALVASLPVRANDPVRLAVRGHADFWIELRAEDLSPTEARVHEGALVFERAGRELDLVHVAEAGRVEEIRWLRGPSASKTARWTLRKGAEIADVRVRGGRVEIVGHDGYVRLETEAAFAIDADGRRRQVELRLEDSAIVAALDDTGLRYPIAVDPVWTSGGSMSKVRYAHVSTTLADGRVLVAGGTDGTFSHSTAEIYNPSTGTWSATGSMSVVRSSAQAVRLLSGKVLVAGGFGASTAELYDPSTGTWATAGSFAGLAQHAIALNPVSGFVYVAGVAGGGHNFSAYNPTTNTWATKADTIFGRESAGLTVFASGTKVLVAGGAGSGVSAEVYDIATDKWTLTGSLAATHDNAITLTLPTTKILLLGGGSSEVYDPSAGTWGSPLAMKDGLVGFTADLLPSNKAIAVGGYDGLTRSELLDVASGGWSYTSPMVARRHTHAMSQMSAGRLLVTGGVVGATVHSSAEIFQLMANGSTCSLGIDCSSGLCVDGACCNTSCTGACQACDVSGSAGTCTSVASGKPHGSRSCAPYAVCTAGACATTCTTSADCDASNYCSGGACVPRLSNGTACTATDQCLSNQCTDGVCCNSACGGQCQACDVAGSVGSCTTISGVPHGTRSACAGVGVGTTCGQTCNGVDATKCNYPPVTTSCSGNTCASGIETHLSLCDGAGKCSDTAKSCGAYACGSSACKSSCTVATTKLDCAPGYYCAGTSCVPAVDLGKDCSSATECTTGFCTDGVCCGVAACAAGSSCANVGKKGSCSKNAGTSCATPPECGSGFCADSVCCDGSCDGQCEACDAPGKLGRCFPVAGSPHGTRAKCDDGKGDVCKALSCNGAKDTTKCVEFTPSTIECKAATCTGSTETTASLCDGTGTCRTPEVRSCAPYACDATRCRTSCTASTHCAPGNVCVESVCVPNKATCSSDGLSSVKDGVETKCDPYRCRGDGTCGTNCASSSDCAPGSSCDGSGHCLPLAAPETESSGGCSIGANRGHGSRDAGGLALLSLCGVLVAARVRRRRASAIAVALPVAAMTVAACSSDSVENERRAPTSALIVAETREAPKHALLDRLATMPMFANHLGKGQTLEPTRNGGYRLARALPRAGWSPAGASALEAVLPAHASDALRLSIRGREGFWIEVTAADLSPVAARVHEGALVFEHATSTLDVVHVAEHGRVEEIRFLRSTDAPSTARYTIRKGPEIASVRVRDGRVEIVGKNNYVRLATEPAFAVDANGVRREVTMRLESSNGTTLVAALDPAGLTYPVAFDPVWTSPGNMSAKRRWPLAVTLTDGRVLVAGGSDGTFALSSAEIYDPTAGTWSAAATMKVARSGGEAIRLNDGRVLAIGGAGTYTCETYDATSNTWTLVGSSALSGGFGLALNPSTGVVYAAGSGGYSNVFESFDPTTNVWTTRATMLVSREGPGLFVLPGGTKLLAAGTNGSSAAGEVYDIATNTWKLTTTTMVVGHPFPFAALVGGKAHVIGAFAVHDIYDPSTDSFVSGPTMKVAREPGSAGAMLPGEKVLISGGYPGHSTSELYDPATGVWTVTSPMVNGGRFNHRMATMSAGRVLLVGGYTSLGPASTAELFQLMANGAACSLAIDCASGLCVDGVCCNATCTGACQACDVTGSVGTCAAVASGKPHGSRSCAPYGVCAAGACATTCTTSADCDATHYCSSGSCIARLSNGTSCSKTDMCLSNQCVDSVCCNSACGGQCQACDVAGSVGSCTTISGVPHGTRTACAGVGVGTTCGQTCNGVDATKCNYPPVTTSCSGNTCASGIETHLSLCDGAGKCSDTAKSCGAYACGSSACKSSCTVATTKLDCAPGYYCAGTSCVPAVDLGKECSSATECSTGFCTDGVCCGVAACDAGSSCANPGKKGSCSKTAGTSCASPPECGSGFCTDSVCCDAACDGQCEACDAPGKAGKCFPIVGSPHGTRAKCDDGKGEVCKALSCNGAKDTTKCVDFAPATVECKAATCVASTETTASLCDGAGTCRAGADKSCAPYACGDKGCRTSCTTKEHCSTGNTCVDGVCAPNRATCSSDGLSSVKDGVETKCEPYRCRGDGTCGTNCASSSDCAPGSSCDGSGHCVPLAAEATDSSGGCAMGSAHGADDTSGSFAVLSLALLVAVRRRVARSVACNPTCNGARSNSSID